MRSLQHLRQVVFDLRFLPVVQRQDVLKSQSQVRDVFFNVAALAVGLGRALALAEIGGEPAAGFLQGKGQLLENLRVVGDGLLALAGKGTHTLAMCRKKTIGPTGSPPRGCGRP